MKRVLVAGIAVLLSGCWMPPSASLRPGGKPRTGAEAIEVEPVTDSARVEAVNRVARTVELSISGAPRRAYTVAQSVRNWSRIRTGDQVRATITEVMTVFVPPLNRDASANAGLTDRSHGARVLAVDPSYRLLRVQYPNGGTETFKMTLGTPMNGIEPGASVAIGTPEVIDLRAR